MLNGAQHDRQERLAEIDGKEEITGGRDDILNRRGVLKAAGAALVAMTGFVGTSAGRSDSAEYELIEVPAGERHTLHVGEGETVENVLLDITQPGATFEIRAAGCDWTLRNVGVHGVDDTNESEFIVEGVEEGREALIENVYLGDGNSGETQGQAPSVGLYVHANHAGTLRIENLNIQNWSDNGVYASGPGNPDSHSLPGGNGVVEIEDSYAADNHVSGFRLGTDGSYCRNCVSYNNQRGFWAYGQHTELIECDLVDNGHDITCGSTWYDSVEVTTKETRFDSTDGNSVDGIRGDSTGEPERRMPDGVPTSPEEAASAGN